MNFPKKTLLASLLMISAGSALAANTANLNIKGTIEPASCNITLAGGDIDYGVITLVESGQTELPEKTVTYSVDCGRTPAPISLSWVDERVPNTPSSSLFGIRALEGSAEIGTYTIEQIVSSSKVGNSQSHLLMRDGGGAWASVATNEVPVKTTAGREITHSLDDRSPEIGSIYTGEYKITGSLKEGLSSASEITLDGQATVTVKMI